MKGFQKIIFLGVFFSLFYVTYGKTETFWFLEKKIKIKKIKIQLPSKKVIVSVNQVCWKKKTCVAILAFKKMWLEKGISIASEQLQYGIDPGAIVCAKLKGKEILGRDKDKNEESFCSFKDHSKINLGSLRILAH